MRMSSLRATLLLAMGLQSGCLTTGSLVNDDTDTDDTDDTDVTPLSCDETPKATKDNVATVEEQGGQWMICGDLPESGSCKPLETLSNYTFVYENLGPTSDPDFCGWDVVPVCGPEEAITDACCYVFELGVICEGRPLRVDGEHVAAQTRTREDWLSDFSLNVDELSAEQLNHLSCLWREAALAEHASVAAFAKFVLELMWMGAPAELVAEAQEAMGDEIRHAKLCFALTSIFSGASVGPGSFAEAASSGQLSIEEMMLGVVIDGCINETIAASIAQVESELARDAALSAVLADLAADERRHSALSWKALRWLLSEHPDKLEDVHRWFDQGLEAQWKKEESSHEWTHSWGRLSGQEKQSVVRQTIQEVIGPCAKKLLLTCRQESQMSATIRA